MGFKQTIVRSIFIITLFSGALFPSVTEWSGGCGAFALVGNQSSTGNGTSVIRDMIQSGSHSGKSEFTGRAWPGPGPGWYEQDMLAMASGWGGGGGWGWGNRGKLDLFTLFGGLWLAGILGVTIWMLVTTNRSGRRRRSADGLRYLEDDEFDFSEDEQRRGLTIVDLIDAFLDNKSILSLGQSENKNTKRKKVHLGPEIEV